MSEMICTVCGEASEPKRITKGSIFIEIVLWLCFIVPGIIYSIWRLSSRYDACRSCGSTNIVPVGSPVGKNLVSTFHPATAAQILAPSSAENFGRKLGSLFASKKK